MAPELLFVYGTLMRCSDRPLARRLRQQARFAGHATVQGRLYRLGSYPGAVASGHPADRVHGEVFDITAAPPALLAALDHYEGCAADQPRPHPYVKQKTCLAWRAGRGIHCATAAPKNQVVILGLVPRIQFASNSERRCRNQLRRLAPGAGLDPRHKAEDDSYLIDEPSRLEGACGQAPAWVYWTTRPVSQLVPIPGGRWYGAMRNRRV